MEFFVFLGQSNHHTLYHTVTLDTSTTTPSIAPSPETTTTSSTTLIPAPNNIHSTNQSPLHMKSRNQILKSENPLHFPHPNPKIDNVKTILEFSGRTLILWFGEEDDSDSGSAYNIWFSSFM